MKQTLPKIGQSYHNTVEQEKEKGNEGRYVIQIIFISKHNFGYR